MSIWVCGKVRPDREAWPFSPVVSLVAVLEVEIESFAAIIRGIGIAGVGRIGDVYLYLVKIITDYGGFPTYIGIEDWHPVLSVGVQAG